MLFRSRTGEIEVGNWGFDRSSVVKADPGRWLGTITDGPWAPTYGNWYAKAPFKQEEPPADHPIRKIWDLWEKVQVEPDEARRNALFQDLLNVHKAAPNVVGIVGEIVAPMIVSNAFGNVLDGYIADDTLRDYGLVNPQQFTRWMWDSFVDAAEWVMVPNVIGMSLHADGGMMASKPYAAGGAYIDRMSNYCKGCAYDRTKRVGDDACPFTTLYWDFLLRHADR